MKRRLNKFLLKLVLFALPVMIGFEILFRLGFYPVITTSQVFDYKMLLIQKHPVREVKFLAIGSSAALYDLNSEVIAKNISPPYYNFSSWGLQIKDAGVILQTLVREYKPRYVMVLSLVRDFMESPNDSYANYARAPIFIRNRFPEYFYIANYNSIHSIMLRKYQSIHPDFDRWGGAPVAGLWKDGIRNDRSERLVFPTAYSETQYKALDSLGAFLQEQGIGLIFVQAPMQASYTDTPTARASLATHFERCRSIIGARHGVYLNCYDTTVFTDSLFADLTHLNNAGTIVLTNKIVAGLKDIIQ